MMKTLFVEKNILSRDIQNIFLSLSLKELKGKWIIEYFYVSMFLFRCFCMLLIWVVMSGNYVDARTGKALVVAIGKYPIDSGWENIHGDNDGVLVFELLNRNHYQQIILLKNEQATKGNINLALQKLYEDVETGDYVFLHFSCHGQQMMDLNGDEEDGLDEALIPYDALFWYLPGIYEGEKHFSDDELGEWIDRFRHKLGKSGQVFVILDACHSGTANRYADNIYIRGVNKIFAPDNYRPLPGRHLERSMKLKSLDHLAPVMILSACKPEETNYEYYSRKSRCYYGKLTYSFVQVAERQSAGLTAEGWCKIVNKTMRQLSSSPLLKLQHPYMESSDKEALFILSVIH